jgi:hypothetical protein
MVNMLHNNLKVPVTCKIRILRDPQQTLALALRLQEAGCSLLTVHGRTKEMKKDLVGVNDFAMIARIKAALRIPVFSNGGIETYADVQKCLSDTGVDGVMSSESVLENPALFSGIGSDPKSPQLTPSQQRLAAEYMELAQKYPTKHTVRPHLFKLLFKQLTHHTDVRDFLAFCDGDGLPMVLSKLAEKDKAMKDPTVYDRTPSWYNRFRAGRRENGHPITPAIVEANSNSNSNSTTSTATATAQVQITSITSTNTASSNLLATSDTKVDAAGNGVAEPEEEEKNGMEFGPSDWGVTQVSKRTDCRKERLVIKQKIRKEKLQKYKVKRETELQGRKDATATRKRQKNQTQQSTATPTAANPTTPTSTPSPTA